MHFMRQNAGTGAGSGDTVSIGPCLDSAGAEYTGLVIGDLTITKNGSSAAMAANATLTHVSNGFYDLVMIGNNADTLGKLTIRCNKSTYQIPPAKYIVLPAMIYDSFVAGSDRLDVNVTHAVDTAWASGAITNNTIASDTGLKSPHGGTATAGSTTQMTLAVGASAVDNFYRGMNAVIFSGTGAGQNAIISSYTGATRIAVFDRTLGTALDNTSGYRLMPQTSWLDFSQVAAAIWNALTATYTLAGSFGKFIQDRLDVVLSTRAAPGAQMDLVNAPNATALTAIGARLEAMILDEGDATALLAAIASKIEAFLINEGDATATMAAIATAVRTNLAVELARIDVVLSTRLSAAGYTVPPTAVQNATQVRTELTPELARILLSLPAFAPDANQGLPTVNKMEDLLSTSNNDTIAQVLAGIIADHGNGSYLRNTEPDNASAVTAAAQATLAASRALDAKTASEANKVVIDKYATMIIADGGVYQYTVNALELAPSGGSGGTAPTVEEIEAHLASLHGAGQWDATNRGAGGDEVTIHLAHPGVEVWITSDASGQNIVAGTLITDVSGDATFLLDAGETYYLWAQKLGFNSIQGEQFIAVAD